MILYCDNLGSLHLSINPIFHARIKHIHIVYHFVREKVVDDSLENRYIHSSRQLVDIFTKLLAKSPFQELHFIPGVHNVPLSSLKRPDKLENKTVEKSKRKNVEFLQILNSNDQDIGSNDKAKS